MTEYIFIGQDGEYLADGTLADSDVQNTAHHLAVKYQTSVTVAVRSFEVPRPVCGCGEPLELNSDNIISCPACATQPAYTAQPGEFWKLRPEVTGLMKKYNISREVAADIYLCLCIKRKIKEEK